MQSTQRELRFSFNISNPTWQFLNSDRFKQTQYKNWTIPQRNAFLTLLAGKRNKQQLQGIFDV